MTYEYNKEAFNEQVEFLKILAKKLELDDYNRLGSYLCNCSKKKKDFLNKQLIKYINDGELTNWLVNIFKEKSIKEIGELDIDYFWESYWHILHTMSLDVRNYDYVGVPSNFTDEEIKKLQKVRRSHCFYNSLVDFHESEDDDDDGNTVFAYSPTRRYM